MMAGSRWQVAGGWRFVWIWLLWGMLSGAGCSSQPELVVPTLMPVAALPQEVSDEGVVPVTFTPGATAVSLPAPSEPTATAVSTPTIPPPVATDAPVPTAGSEACRPAAALTGVQPRWIVRPGPWPRPPAAPGLLGQMPDRGLKLLHLGFDVEGDPAAVADLLAALEQRQVQTTFFVLGSWADTYPEWVQEIARRGHELASHGYSHADMRHLTADTLTGELASAERAVQELTGQTPRPWLRPPFGAYDSESVRAAYEAGYTTVIWSGSANDWRSGMDADRMCRTLRYYAVPGAILYAHTNRPEIVTAVDRFIGEMQAAGYTFVPLSVLMADDPAGWLQPAED